MSEWVWVAFDPVDQDYYDTIPADSPKVYRTLLDWGYEGAVIEMVRVGELDTLLGLAGVNRFGVRGFFSLLFSFARSVVLLLFNLILHPFQTLRRVLYVSVLGVIVTQSWHWFYHHYGVDLW